MKSFLVLMSLALAAPYSFGFIPKLNCYHSQSGDTPVSLEYIDDGMIEVSHGTDSCELDVDLSGEADAEWIRFINNNGWIDSLPFNSRCKAVILSVFPEKRSVLADIQRLDLSRKLASGRLGDEGSARFPARLYFVTQRFDATTALEYEPLSCRIAD